MSRGEGKEVFAPTDPVWRKWLVRSFNQPSTSPSPVISHWRRASLSISPIEAFEGLLNRCRGIEREQKNARAQRVRLKLIEIALPRVIEWCPTTYYATLEVSSPGPCGEPGAASRNERIERAIDHEGSGGGLTWLYTFARELSSHETHARRLYSGG